MLTAAQINLAKQFLQAAISKNTTLSATVARSYGDDSTKWPANTLYEAKQRFDLNGVLQIIHDNVEKLAG